jgi:mannonate dehydratase
MKIDKVEVFVSRPGRNYVTTRITTDTGVVGVGDATLNGRELAVAAYLRDHIGPLLVGRDAHKIEDTWQYLYRGGYWRRGPVTMAAIASIDMALWDIKGKVAGLPVYQLLGGESRTSCLTYGHASGRDVEELFDSVRRLQAMGYKAIRLQVGVPGLGTIYGTGEGALPGELKKWPQPLVEEWDTSKYLRFLPGVFEAARNEFGDDLHLLHDSHHRLTPIEAARLARDLDPYRLFWLEDVTPAENQEAMRLVRQSSTTPLAIGEVFNSAFDTNTLISEQLIDYVRMSVTHGGGITPVKRIFEYAGMYQVKTACHGPEDISPVGMAAALHIGLSAHNFGIQEFARYSQAAVDVFAPEYTFAEGSLRPAETPGLGVSYDADLGEKYEYEPSYLPVNRLADGTVHDW